MMNQLKCAAFFCLFTACTLLQAQNSDSINYEYAFINNWGGRVKVFYENKPHENLREKLSLHPDADNDSIISSDIFKVIHYMESKGYEPFLFASYPANKRFLFRKKVTKKTK
jgi:hypothetical protein